VSANSESRKRIQLEQERREACARAASKQTAAREALQYALAEVWSGADFTDTDAVLDHLRDVDARVEVGS
jgi:hypothetical protein